MPVTVHVNGPALLQVGFNGGALQDLGVSESGVDWVVHLYDEPIKADTAGPMMAADVQDMGMDAEGSVRMVFWDDSVLEGCLQRNNAPAPGQLGSIGIPIGLGGDAIRLVITSDQDLPHRFLTCIVRGPQRKRLSTRYATYDLRFYAWALIGPTDKTALGKKLYDRIAA